MSINNQNIITRNIKELKELLCNLSEDDFLVISQISSLIAKTLKLGGCVFWCGNGGSASQSQHFAAELIGRFKKSRRPYNSLSLNSDTSVITCISNDFGYENLFSRQLEGLGNKGDLVIVLSTSGNSINLKNVVDKAKMIGIKSIAILGSGGGLIKNNSDFEFIINSSITSRIQEMHNLIGHIICEIVEAELDER